MIGRKTKKKKCKKTPIIMQNKFLTKTIIGFFVEIKKWINRDTWILHKYLYYIFFKNGINTIILFLYFYVLKYIIHRHLILFDFF